MKFIHLSDLHIGKHVNGFSMLENKDQQYILDEILKIIKSEAPDAVIIAGDVYDRSLPPTEAVTELDEFIFRLSEEDFDTFIISGNHDSAERLAFGSRIMAKNGIHISPVYSGVVEPVPVRDDFGEVNVYNLPFIKPFHVRHYFPDKAEEINTYSDALKTAIEHMNVDTSKRNIIVSHQFVTGAETSDSETSVGGTDNVDCTVYDPFDYVALGHIHSPQKINGIEHIRYCGTPLKYSFSEKRDKSVTVVEMAEKGKPVVIREIPLKPLRDMRIITGLFDELCRDSLKSDDYICAVLTDDYEVRNAMGKLRTVYPNIMELRYSRNESINPNTPVTNVDVEKKNSLELFGDFFKMKQGRELNEEERAYMDKLISEIEEEENATD